MNLKRVLPNFEPPLAQRLHKENLFYVCSGYPLPVEYALHQDNVHAVADESDMLKSTPVLCSVTSTCRHSPRGSVNMNIFAVPLQFIFVIL